jgi:hypothetical protein
MSNESKWLVRRTFRTDDSAIFSTSRKSIGGLQRELFTSCSAAVIARWSRPIRRRLPPMLASLPFRFPRESVRCRCRIPSIQICLRAWLSASCHRPALAPSTVEPLAMIPLADSIRSPELIGMPHQSTRTQDRRHSRRLRGYCWQNLER